EHSSLARAVVLRIMPRPSEKRRLNEQENAYHQRGVAKGDGHAIPIGKISKGGRSEDTAEPHHPFIDGEAPVLLFGVCSAIEGSGKETYAAIHTDDGEAQVHHSIALCAAERPERGGGGALE